MKRGLIGFIVAAVTFALAPAHAAVTVHQTYDVRGAYRAGTNSDGQFGAAGKGQAGNCTGDGCANAPDSGTFAVAAQLTPDDPSHPCALAKGTGRLGISWSDGTTSAVRLGYYALRPHHTRAKGRVVDGTLKGSYVSFAIDYPDNPCVTRTSFTGTLSFGTA